MPTPVQPDIPGLEPDPNDKLGQIMALAKKMEELHLLQQEKCKELEALTEEGKQIQEVALPDLMMEIGLTELTLNSGRKITIKREYFPSISKDRWEKAKKWLEEHKMDSIIKAHCIVDEKYRMQLAMSNLPFELKEGIHPQTLKALVKEQCELPNSDFPRDIFGVFEKTSALVREP